MDRTQWTDKNSKREAVSHIKWILRCEGSGVGVASLKGTRLSSTIGPVSISKSVMSWSEKKQKISQKIRENIGDDFFLGFIFPVSKLEWVFRQNEAILGQNEAKIYGSKTCNKFIWNVWESLSILGAIFFNIR